MHVEPPYHQATYQKEFDGGKLMLKVDGKTNQACAACAEFILPLILLLLLLSRTYCEKGAFCSLYS
jgi:hypothetical protein